MYKKFVTGGLAGVLSQLINLASRVILPPIFIENWGTNTYGDWLVLTSFVSYLALSDIGAQLYIVNKLTMHQSVGNEKAYKEELKSGIIFFTLLPLIAFAVLIAFLYLTVESNNLFHRINSDTNFFAVIFILGLSYVISLPLGIILGIYRSKGFISKSIMLSNIAAISQLIITIYALKNNIEMIGVAVCTVLPNLFIFFYAILNLNKNYPYLEIYKLEKPNIEIIKKSIKPSLHFFNIQISQALNIQGILLVVGLILGSSQVVIFSVMRTVVNSARQILSLIINTCWHELTYLYSTKKYEELKTLFQLIYEITLFLTLLISGLLIIYGEKIFILWLGSDFIYDPSLMDLFLIYIVQFILWTTAGNLLMSINLHKKYSKLMFISSLLSILCAFLGGNLYGLKGVIIGMIIVDIILPIWLVPLYVVNNFPNLSINFFIKNFTIASISIALMIITPKLIILIIIINLLILIINTKNRYL
ncbi:MATE family efflux transporter [Polynucleobacter sp. HIN5]|uniref:hypothetical protein n=1 Tax=Polynucleobacter sp. HIN5 TaxID=3047864 RepID=UPI0025742481|nr:hypothetical protein [Polynucleobacter sp. HIN5]BEI32947.1 hypothetical protein PHIN5_03150 [Polynucleobacter sp. HIN5]